MNGNIKSSRTRYLLLVLALVVISGLTVVRLNSNRTVHAAPGSAAEPPAASADTIYTGVWKGDDGATYYVRYVGDEIFWYGQGQGFGNVFYGKIQAAFGGNPRRIVGRWADVPVGGARNAGDLSLTIASPTRFVVLGEPGNFAARELKKQ